MQGYQASWGIGFVTALRSMTACAALSWAASRGRTRIGSIPGDSLARSAATAAALAEMAGDNLLGRAARGGTTRSRADWARALTEDAVAAGLATDLVCLTERPVEQPGSASPPA